MKYLRGISVLAAALFLLLAPAGCGSGDNESEEGGSTTIGGMKGTPGQTVTLELKNEGENPHTLTISDAGVDTEVQPGDEAEADVTFPQSGELTFVCRFHEGKGMVGALEVSSSPSTTTSTTTSSSDY